MILSSFLTSLLVLSVRAQSSSYTDSRTQITFQAFNNPSGYTFGLSLPTTPQTDFIGILTGGIDGWAGVSLGGGMVGNLLISAWANGNQVITAFRKATAYSPPPTVTGTYSIQSIANGTYVNETHFTLTFLCKGCILDDGSTFAATDTDGYLGWAMSSTRPTSPSDTKSGLEYHDNFGLFGIDLVGARSPNYGQWASLAMGNSTQWKRSSYNSSRHNFSAKRSLREKQGITFTNLTSPTGSTGTVKPQRRHWFRGVSGLKYN